MLKKLSDYIFSLKRFIDHWWYGPLMAVVAFADLYLLVFPVDAFLLSTVFLQPQKWVKTAIWFTIGSSLGICSFVFVVDHYGMDFLIAYFPALVRSSIWTATQKFFADFGLWVLFGTVFSAVPQQPAAAIVTLAKVPFLEIFTVVWLGRTMKYFSLCWVARFAPKYIARLWKLPGEEKPPTSSVNL